MTTTPEAIPEAPAWIGHPSHWHYFWRWLFAALLIAASIAGPIAIGRGQGAQTQGPSPLWFIPAGLGVIIIIGIFIARGRETYTVMPSKVMIEVGLVAKSSDELRIQDIRSIAVKKHGIAGLIGLGDIEFSTAARADAEIVFSSVARVDRVRDLVRRHQGS